MTLKITQLQTQTNTLEDNIKKKSSFLGEFRKLNPSPL